MRKFIASVCLGSLLVCVSFAEAGLIGDTLTFSRAYPAEGTLFGGATVSTTVSADNSDLVTLQSPFWDIDPGDSNVFIDVQASSTMVGSVTVFDGIVITGFSQTITNATFTTNHPAFVFALSFDANSIALNLTGSFDASYYVNIEVETASDQATVPEPASLAIFGVGALAAGIRRRKRQTA